MSIIRSKTVVLIAGAFVSHTCWDEWKRYFEEHGYKVVVPPWPFKDASAEDLRKRQPMDIDLAALTFPALVAHFNTIIKDLPEKPIVVGHSLGGLITQIIINNDLAAAGIAIHSAPPLGVVPYELSFLKAGWKALGLFTSTKKTYLMSFSDWQKAFTNGMALKEQKEAYEKFAIPESKMLLRGALTSAAKIDFKKNHVPLLFTSGSHDMLIPARLNFRNYNKYERNGSVLDYKEFNNKNHYVLGQSDWHEEAEYILQWIHEHSLDKAYVPVL